MFTLKKSLIFFILLFLLQSPFAQKTSGDFYTFLKDGSPTQNVDKAAFLLHVFALNDTTFISRYYHFKGPMIRQETYKDSGLTVPNGRFCWYNEIGELDSTGEVTNGRKDGDWQYIISKTETHSVTYVLGVKTKEKIYHYDKNGKYINNDSANMETKDSTEKKADFKTGVKDWSAYCQHNLQTPQRLQNVLRDGIHTCLVSFIIDEKGNTGDIYLYKSCEWSGDAEVMRLIADSPRWQPAVQNGHTVIYRQEQSLSFQVIFR